MRCWLMTTQGPKDPVVCLDPYNIFKNLVYIATNFNSVSSFDRRGKLALIFWAPNIADAVLWVGFFVVCLFVLMFCLCCFFLFGFF